MYLTRLLYIVRCDLYNYCPIVTAMDDTTQKALGLRIKSLRMERGLSQEKFSLMIGIDRTYLASIESGMRNVTLSSMKKIACGFEITVSELLRGIC